MLKYGLTLIIVIFSLLGCTVSSPSLIKSYRMFDEHILEFNEIAIQGCSILDNSNKQFLFLSKTESFISKKEYESFSKLVNAIDPDIVSTAELINDECNIVLQFFVSGIGGTGLSYNFYYNIVPADSELVDDQNLYNLMTGNKYKVHFPLKNDWYLYIQRT